MRLPLGRLGEVAAVWKRVGRCSGRPAGEALDADPARGRTPASLGTPAHQPGLITQYEVLKGNPAGDGRAVLDALLGG